MDIVWWLFVGLAAGALARMVLPGKDRIGIFATLMLGITGSLVGGLLARLIQGPSGTFSPAGFIGSIAGAVVILGIYRARSRSHAKAI